MKRLLSGAGFTSAVVTLLLICLCLGAVNCVVNPIAGTIWVRQFETNLYEGATAISVSTTGVYVAGYGDLTGSGKTGCDAFVRKYDANGNKLWTGQMATDSYDYAYAISTYKKDVYVAGYTQGDLWGKGNFGIGDAFVRKYDADGTELWTQQFGTSLDDVAYAISADATGVYVAGYTTGDLWGKGNFGDNNTNDAFVRKYDGSGQEMWTWQIGTESDDGALAICTYNNEVYVAGTTMGDLWGKGNFGGVDAFARKYNADGHELWIQQFGTSFSDVALAISADATGAYVAGHTQGDLWGKGNFGGNTGFNSNDAFVRKCDISSGNELWTMQLGTKYDDGATAIYSDASGVYVAGFTAGTLPGQNTAGNADAFVRKYDEDGEQIWTRQFGSSAPDAATATYADVTGADPTGVYVAGDALPRQKSFGLDDAFVAKFWK